MRVVAATAIFVLHWLFLSMHLVAPSLRPAAAFVSEYFFLGVQLFYVVSAFALMHSTRRYESQKAWLPEFYIKRFFRIAPLYYVMIPMTIIQMTAFNNEQTSAVEIITNIFFINNLWPQYAFGIPHVGWSVSVEVLFYLAFPLFFVFIRSVWSALALATLAATVGTISRLTFDAIQLDLGITYGHLALSTNFVYFAFGILAYLTYARLRVSRWGARSASLGTVASYHLTLFGLCAGLSGALFVFEAQLRAAYHLDMAVWGLLFAIVVVWVTARDIPLLGLPPIQFLGERSYSLYLMHVAMLLLLAPTTTWVYQACLPMLGALWSLLAALLIDWCAVVAVSSVTYALIEKPGMDSGKWIVRRLRQANLPTAPGVRTSEPDMTEPRTRA